jgi:hypothetical protein
MVNKLLPLSIVAGAGVISACFGEGPTPGEPTRATVLFSGQPLQNCQGTYIGPVAIGAGSGYVTMLPFAPQGGPQGGNCPNQPANEPLDVFAFNKDGGSLTKLGSAGESSGDGHDLLVATATGVAYVYSQPGTMNTPAYVEPGHIQVGSGTGVDTAFGIAQAGSDLYVELTSSPITTGQAEPNNPEYPCCGGGPLNNQAQGSIWKVGGGSIVQVNPVCTTLDRCFVGNSSSLVYFERPMTSGNELWRLTSLATVSLAPTMIASLANGPEVPVGLDADDTTIAYATSMTCSTSNSNQSCSIDECNVFAYDIASGMQTSLLSTRQWGCMDAKLANGYVYFTIVGWSQRTQHMFGKGIGRVKIADKTFESLDLGMRGDAAGPRRIFPSGDRLYLVDPLVMARIDAAELDGKHDFTP